MVGVGEPSDAARTARLEGRTQRPRAGDVSQDPFELLPVSLGGRGRESRAHGDGVRDIRSSADSQVKEGAQQLTVPFVRDRLVWQPRLKVRLERRWRVNRPASRQLHVEPLEDLFGVVFLIKSDRTVCSLPDANSEEQRQRFLLYGVVQCAREILDHLTEIVVAEHQSVVNVDWDDRDLPSARSNEERGIRT